jgi:hypothetical protein
VQERISRQIHLRSLPSSDEEFGRNLETTQRCSSDLDADVDAASVMARMKRACLESSVLSRLFVLLSLPRVKFSWLAKTSALLRPA